MATNRSNTNARFTFQSTSLTNPAFHGEGGAAPKDGREVLQALLAFSTLHHQIRRRRAEEACRYEAGLSPALDVWEFEQFVLDEVLQLVAERAQAITGADGIAIALAEGDEIVCRASTGAMAPDRGVRLDAKAGFSGTCFRTGRIVRCDDSEKDPRVNLEACRRLGTRSMVAVPLVGQNSVVGLLEAFSTEPYGFHDADVRSLNLLAELILGAVRPEEEERIERAAKVAAAELQSAELESLRKIPLSPPLPPGKEPVPLEFAQESIAPELDASLAEGLRPGLMIIVLAALFLTLPAGGVWWLAHRPARHESTAVLAESRLVPTAVPAASSVTPEGTLPTANAGSGYSRITGLPVVTGVRQFASGETSTVVIDLQGRVRYETHRLSDPERIYFDLLNTSLAAGLNGKVIDVNDGQIGRVRVAKPADNVTRVVLYIKPAAIYQHRLEENPFRLVIEVGSKEPALEPEINPLRDIPPIEKSDLAPAIAPPATHEDTSLRAHSGRLRIVIDAGHGGWDLGTIGRGGLLEKDLVLEVAQRLGNLLESRLGSDVIYTRKDDNYVPLEQRAELANQVQADLFISVHANYSDLLTARGVETYYSSFFSPPEAREIEFRENGNATPLIHSKLSGAELKDKVSESRKLAASVQRALHNTLASQTSGIRDRGVKEASFVVLTGTEMPSILAEISFVSSPADEQRLRSTEYRQQIANALCKGVEQFAVNFHRLKMASAANRNAGQ